ncbi:CCAAT-binding transcription factor, subunit B, partial [Cynara cardunculus var. scolymus]
PTNVKRAPQIGDIHEKQREENTRWRGTTKNVEVANKHKYQQRGFTVLAQYCINSMSSTAMQANSADSSSPEQSLDRDSQSDEVLSEEEDDVSKETHDVPYFPSGAFQITLLIIIHSSASHVSVTPNETREIQYGKTSRGHFTLNHVYSYLNIDDKFHPSVSDSYGQGQQNFQHGAPNILPRNEETVAQAPQPELVGHSVPYLHESRHQHAMRRVRSSGGRFAKKTETNASEDKKATGSGASGMKRMQSGQSGESFSETRGGVVNSCNGRTYAVDGGGRYDNQDGFQGSSYHSDIGEGGSLGQQWATMPANQGSQRAVAMK